MWTGDDAAVNSKGWNELELRWKLQSYCVLSGRLQIVTKTNVWTLMIDWGACVVFLSFLFNFGMSSSCNRWMTKPVCCSWNITITNYHWLIASLFLRDCVLSDTLRLLKSIYNLLLTPCWRNVLASLHIDWRCITEIIWKASALLLLFLTVCSVFFCFFSRKMAEKMNSGGDQETKSHDERTEETQRAGGRGTKF